MSSDRRHSGFRRHEKQSRSRLKTLREGGAQAFFAPRRTRGASVMTPTVTARAQQLLADGWSRSQAAGELGLKLDTLRKAVQQGRLVELVPIQREEATIGATTVLQPPVATDKSTRAAEDAVAEMGTGCTRPDERVLAAFGLLDGAPTRFESCRDVPFGGVLSPCRRWRRMVCFDISTIV